MIRPSSAACAAAVVVLAACAAEDEPGARQLTRPVTAFTLETKTPPSNRLLPGVVAPYRRTDVPFRVAGRVEVLISAGDDVVGEQTDRSGEIVQLGTILAELDPAPYERALVRAEQRLQSARLELEAQRLQLSAVLPARLESVRASARAAELAALAAGDDVAALEAEVRLSETTVERNRELLPRGAVSDITLRQSETALQSNRSRLATARTMVAAREEERNAAEAAIAEAEGAIQLQRANNEAREAAIRELEAVVSDARSDLEDCTLRAPFPGRVTALHVGEGSFVQAGAPVVELTMLNPIEATVNVSAELEQDLVVGIDATIYPIESGRPDLENGVVATLYEKRGVADTATRTFEVGLIAANVRRTPMGEGADRPRAPYVLPVLDDPLGLTTERALYTVDDAIADVDGDPWVVRVKGLEQGARSISTLRGVLEAERLPVRLGDRSLRVANITLVPILDTGVFQPGDLLVPDPTPAHAEGFVIDDNRWLLRPGDLVQVALEQSAPPTGFWVPVQAIRERNGTASLFVLSSEDRAREVTVEVFDSWGEERRVESEELNAGDQIVLSGAHFLRDGDAVTRASDGLAR